MDTITILLIALGLAMDAFAVSVAHGVSTKKSNTKDAFRMAFSFGLFQMFMPLLGWLGGVNLSAAIAGFDHWVAFGLLCVIGGKMIYESARSKTSETIQKPLSIRFLLVLSIATSIDALAVGLSFAFLRVSLAIPILAIGVVTFLLSLMGVTFGCKLEDFFENKIEVIGGLALIGIGVKILLEHLI